MERQKNIQTLLRDQGRRMAAYEAPEAIKREDARPAPPTVYRAFSALTGRAATHQSEPLNACGSCRCDHADRVPVLAICDDCKTVEGPADRPFMARFTWIMAATGVHARRHVAELHGLFRTCT
ncbi:transcriptional repressor [Primorskyibacter sp. 2E107]|uniref:transcriptional repressor n=1 Tax=Primorskyibacter sp. 2E107 TaxID=3403458 RepID=UPI003AF9BD1B